MTHARNTSASPASLSLPESELDRRSVRARTEPMTVEALGDALYEIRTENGSTYLVDLSSRRCSCPDHTFRDVRCKHLRRVAIEITESRVPAPGQVAVDCETCGTELFVSAERSSADRSGAQRSRGDEAEAAPDYCRAHDLRPGTVVRDRETGDRLLVVTVSDRRADRVRVGESAYSVATYPNNRGYDPDGPVVGAVYPQSVEIGSRGPEPDELRVYSFPRSRLERVERD